MQLVKIGGGMMILSGVPFLEDRQQKFIPDKIIQNLFKPPKFKNQLIVFQAACKNKSVENYHQENQAIKKAAIRAA